MKPLIFFTFFLLFLSPALASTSTPSATPTGTAETTIEEKVRNIVQQNLSTTEALIKDRLEKSQLVGLVGRLTAIAQENITFKPNGETYQIRTTNKTTYSKNNQPAKLDSLAIDDKVIVIGTMIKDGIIEGKRIVAIKDTVSTLPFITAGKVLSANPKTRTVVIRTKNSDQQFILSRKANLKIDQLAPGKTVIAVSQLQNEDQVITTAKVL